ncbi:YqaE/Pmp3 family membrane protein [Parvularcula sp. LCG005]|nr:YqaE/Pmp3 family membrane protein [Parvularcula sp. LCG005]WOI53928.1 YqaE/Pmp3 family membrane protein [Parvularcula sp. LCG005]
MQQTADCGRCNGMNTHNTPATNDGGADILRILVAILLPPLGVFLQEGIKTQFWINLVLTLLGYIPGIIHAVYIILKR